MYPVFYSFRDIVKYCSKIGKFRIPRVFGAAIDLWCQKTVVSTLPHSFDCICVSKTLYIHSSCVKYLPIFIKFGVIITQPCYLFVYLLVLLHQEAAGNRLIRDRDGV